MKWGSCAIASALVAVAGGSIAAPSPPAGPVPIEAFAALPQVESPRLSPDGTRVLTRIAANGKQVLAILPLSGAGTPAYLQVPDSTDINWWRWVGDDWVLIGVGATDHIDDQEVYVTRTVGANATFSKINKIDWAHSGLRADDVLWVARDGSPHALLSRMSGIDTIDQYYPEVVDADLSTGRVKRVLPSRRNVWRWFADGAGRVRMGYRYIDASRTRELLYRQEGEGEFQSLVVRKRDDTPMTIPDVFRADGTAIATARDSGYDSVYEVSLPDLKLGRKLFALDGYDVDGVISNEADDGIDGVVLTDRARRVAWLDPNMQTIQAEIDKAIGDRHARIVSRDRARNRFLIEVDSGSQAGMVYAYDIREGVMKRFAWNNPAIQGRQLSPVKTIRYAARDGTPIEAVLTLPRARGAKNLPLIVLPHGGPTARDDESFDWWAQFLAESGYAVIQPNYRGSSGYGLAFEKLAEGEWGLKMQDDLVDAVGWAAKEGIADPKRVCIVGGSYGGYAAMRGAERDHGVYRCAVSYAGASDLAELRRYDSEFLNGGAASDWLKRQAPDLKAVSPRYDAAGVSIPVLLVHGKADRRVPVRQSQLMANALKDAGKPYTYIEQPLADHFFTRREDRLEFLKAMKAFLDRYNPPDPA